MKYSIFEVMQSYTKEKKEDELWSQWSAYLIYRPISFMITPLFLFMKIHASVVTTLGMIITFLLPYIAWARGEYAYIYVALFSIVFEILDCVAGNIARITSTSSERGKYLEFISGILFRIMLYVAIGIIIQKNYNHIKLIQKYAVNISLISIILYLCARLSRVHAKLNIYNEYKEKENIVSKDTGRYIYAFLSGIDNLFPFFIIGAGYYTSLEFLLFFLFFYSLGDFIISQMEILAKVK